MSVGCSCQRNGTHCRPLKDKADESSTAAGVATQQRRTKDREVITPSLVAFAQFLAMDDLSIFRFVTIIDLAIWYPHVVRMEIEDL